jgi:mono/diheme cytochrome c family protein
LYLEKLAAVSDSSDEAMAAFGTGNEMLMQTLSRAAVAMALLCAAPLLTQARESRSRPGLNQAAAAPQLQAAAEPQNVLRQYCFTCHNQRLKTGGLVLDALDVSNVAANAETWEKVLRKLQLGVMPPVGVGRPNEATYTSVIGYLEHSLDRASAAQPNPGHPVLHRLNRAEYRNAIRDLLGFDVDVTQLLPPDDSAYGFDNVADVLNTSPALLQGYLSAARKISAVAVGDPGMPAGADTYSVGQDLSQDEHLEDLPLGTVGGLSTWHMFPIDGEYDFQIKLFRTNLNAIRGLQSPHQLELALDGSRILLADLGGDADLVAVQTNPTEASDAIETKRLRIRLFAKAGRHDISAAFLGESSPRLETNRLQRFVRDFNPYDAEGAPHVQSVTVKGPFNPTKAWNPVSPQVFLCHPKVSADDTPCARRILTILARRAYRGPVSPDDVKRLMVFYQKGRAEGSFEAGIEFVLRSILVSPEFVFRAEAAPAAIKPGVPYRVTDYELASRLSFFLWSSIPDETLLDLASVGRLHRPDVLAQQVRRMLADARANAFVENFAGQWLQLRNLKRIVPNSDIFPDFDDNLRQASQREAELFFGSIVREDRNTLDLMTADYTFVNERLARHYRIPGIVGSNFRRVQLSDPARWGLLGKSAVLLVTSHANTTSPVLRGKWVLENVLGAPPPPPPPNVPALKENEPGTVPRTMREQMEQHRANPVCAACHKNMDPIGFVLENFDAVGAWRTTNEGGVPLNTVDVLADGTKVTDVASLRAALLKRPSIFLQTLTEKLMIYALGRGLTYQDEPTARRIVRNAESQGNRFSALIMGIVDSEQFQMRVKLEDEVVASNAAPLPPRR